MRFSAWPFLLLALLIPLLHRWWRKRNRPAAIRFPIAVSREVSRASSRRFFQLIKYVGLIFFITALARPQSSNRQVERKVNGLDIMMVMDVSASMNIEDLSERSRFDIAKDTMEAFIKGRQNDRIGFLIFSGEPLTLAPPTLDYGLVMKALRDARIGVLKDGTGIGDGLSLAVNRLKNSPAKTRVIILLTDGDNNVGQVDPATAGELAAGYDIRVYTIAIGREGRVRMPVRTKSVFGRDIVNYQYFENALNPALLQQIAESTNGKFYRVTDEQALDSVFKEIDQLEKTDLKTTEKIRYDEKFQTPLLLGLFLVLLEFLTALLSWGVLP